MILIFASQRGPDFSPKPLFGVDRHFVHFITQDFLMECLEECDDPIIRLVYHWKHTCGDQALNHELSKMTPDFQSNSIAIFAIRTSMWPQNWPNFVNLIILNTFFQSSSFLFLNFLRILQEFHQAKHLCIKCNLPRFLGHLMNLS